MIKTNEKISLLQASLLTGAVAVLLLLLSLSSQPVLVYLTSIFLSTTLAVLCAGFTIFAWRSLRNHDQAGKILLGFVLVFSFWAVAEVLWMVFMLLGIEPYPSLADLFWVVGYLPLMIVLTLNARFLNVKLTEPQKQVIFFVLLAGFLLTTILVFIPIMVDFSTDRLLEGLINLAYPILDLILLFFTLRLYYIALKSKFRVAWLVIALGLSLTIAADLAYSVATWHELYSAEHENLLSKVIDWGYLAGYPVFTLGIFAFWLGYQYQTNQAPQAEAELAKESPPILANANFLIYTDQEEEVIDFSSNLVVFRRNLVKKAFCDFLADLTGLDMQESQQLCHVIRQEISSKGIIKDFRVPLSNINGGTSEAWLSGVRILNPLNEFVGMNLILRAYLPGANPETGLSSTNQGIARYILDRCGIQEYPIKDTCFTYVEQILHQFYQVLVQEMGEAVANRMLQTIASASNEQNWGIVFEGGKIIEKRPLEIKPLSAQMAAMLRIGIEYMQKMAGDEMVTQGINAVRKTLDESKSRIIKDFGLSQ